MYCKTCGKEINENAVVCPHCGCATENEPIQRTAQQSRMGVGILLGLLLGLIGLIIGLVMFKAKTVERTTFMKGWTIGFVIAITPILILIGLACLQSAVV